MGGAAEEAYVDASAEGAFSNYSNAQAELDAAPKGSARAALLTTKRDELWQAYVAAGGQRIAWHFPPNDPRQEEGRSSGGIELPILLFEHSTFVYVARFWIGVSQRDTDQWEVIDAQALRVWQQNNHLPITGNIDRVTWSAMLELAYEVASAPSERGKHDVATGQGSKAPTVLTVERKQPWMLALDNVSQLTFANHWNLALMSVLAYAEGDHIDQQLKALGERTYRDRVQLLFEYPDDYKRRFAEVTRHRNAMPLIYGEKQRVRPFVRPATGPYQSKFISHDGTHSQAFVAWNEVHVIIAVRGTQTDPDNGLWEDLNTDAKANPKPWPYGGGGQVHTGFFAAFDAIRTDLDQTLERALGESYKPIFVCGHSLGGAVATLVSCYLRTTRRRNPVRLYTYGQPRVGNVAFATEFWKNEPSFAYYRTANALDLVTWVPAIWAVPEARQFGELAKLALRMYSGALKGMAADPMTGEIPQDYEARVIEDERKRSKAIDDYLRANLKTQEDYRHFGVHIACGTDETHGLYLLPTSQSGGRKVEAWQVPRSQGLYELSVFKTLWHAMNHTMFDGYLAHLTSFFERNQRAYLTGTPRVPLASPDLPRIEARLFERMLKHERNNWTPPETWGGVLDRAIQDWWESES